MRVALGAAAGMTSAWGRRWLHHADRSKGGTVWAYRLIGNKPGPQKREVTCAGTPGVAI